MLCERQEVKGTRIFTQKRSHPDETLTCPDAYCKNNIQEKKTCASEHSTTSFGRESHTRLDTEECLYGRFTQES
jgi:hypothetical protein